MHDLEAHLNRLWKTIFNLQFKCKVDFAKLNSIPELDLNSNGIVEVDSLRRSSILKRIRLFRALERYKAIHATSRALGYIVLRDIQGKHSISKDFENGQ